MILQRCAHPRPCYDDGKCHYKGECGHKAPLINADRIRSMTDDELNELFHEIYNAGAEDAVAYEWGQRTNSFEWTMEWLQQPAEEDGHDERKENENV